MVQDAETDGTDAGTDGPAQIQMAKLIENLSGMRCRCNCKITGTEKAVHLRMAKVQIAGQEGIVRQEGIMWQGLHASYWAKARGV